MINSLQITATIDQPQLLEDKVEKLAYRRYDPGYGMQKMPDDHEVIETSSTEAYVTGTVEMNNSGEQINMPFITCFVFTCIKRKNSVYKLEWSSSLS
jgi:hypothetical protein